MIRPRSYEILARAVEDGVRNGWRRAHKHTDSPWASYVQDCVESAVMDAICEVFSFDDPKDPPPAGDE